MRNWRVATRLNAILLIPVLLALVFGGFQVESAVATWQRADDTVRIADLVRAATSYSNALENERDSTAVPLLTGRRDAPEVAAAYAATDDAARAFDRAAVGIPEPSDLRRRMASFRAVEPQLPSLRKAAYTGQLSGVQTEEWYVKIQHPLMELANELGYGTSNSAAYGRTLYAVSLAKAAESLTRSIGTHILVEKSPSAKELAVQKTALGSYQYLEGIAVQEYAGGGTADDQARLSSAQAAAEEKGKAQVAAAQAKARSAGTAFVVPPTLTTMVTEVADPASTPQKLAAEGITPQTYAAAATLSFDAYRTVEVHLAQQAAKDASRLAANARRTAFVNSAVVVVAVILAFIVSTLMARGMSRRMRRLRAAAADIAEKRLPELVDRLSRHDPGRVDTEVRTIPISTRDEIGEVARAFDQVHREAVRLAAEQALLRGNVNAIFTNLSQRNQGLIQRQLALITELENNEADPDQLENLFRMDHLATRMRRNGENLLVLAGEEPGRQWNQPVPLVDVLRAAASEVEAYDRIELVGIPETDIHGSAVTDLVHLLAELLENATSFSSPQTRVRVTATRMPDGRVMIEIHDKGIGLTAEDFADINHKLAQPPTVDVEIAKRMGLFVVGRLADRHGIRVQLRPSGEQAGTTSLVMLPEPITRGGGGDELPEADSDFTVAQIAPEERDRPVPPAGLVPSAGPGPLHPEVDAGRRAAAELGFDDSRYERDQHHPHGPQTAEAPRLDPVRRSRRSQTREARRAQPQPRPQPQQPAQPQPAAAAADGQGNDPADLGQPFAPGGQPGFVPQDAPPQDFSRQGFPAQGYPQEAYPQQAYQEPAGYPDQGYQGGGFTGGPYGGGYQDPYDPAAAYGGQQEFGGAAAQEPPDGHRAEFTGHAPAQEGWPVAEPQVTESSRRLPEGPSESVVSPSLTDAGLPRRERQQPGSTSQSARSESSPQSPQPQHTSHSPQEQPVQDSSAPPESPQPDGDDWRSTNDEHWQRAEQVREPKAGGVTPSGLPRRVPRANLVPGAAAQTPQGGPQVSRAPEDVRGRLSNLRRGVQQGRTAGTDTNGQATDSRFGGPQNQER